MLNKIFGKLTVLEKTEQRDGCGRIIWKCQCECGNYRFVDTSNLRNGNIHCCVECGKKEGIAKRKKTLENKPIKNDLTGQKFGRLTVLEPTKKRTKDRCIIWKCKCDCGKEIEVSSKSLKQSNTKSCGCLSAETRAAQGRANKKDLTGMIFGRLTVLEDSGERYDNNILWRCQCECGNQPLIKGTSLLHGVQSCGCLQSKGEARISEILSAAGIKFETQKTFENCRFKDSNRPAFFDFYLPDYNLLIEYDGEQHFHCKNSGWNTKENFEKTKIRDAYKDSWCQENGIKLKRIPYTHFGSLTLNDLIGGVC